MPQQYSFEYERRLRAGIVGCGQHSVRNILPALLYAPVDLVAACDLDIERAEQVGRRFGASGFYGNYLEMIEKEQLDAVYMVVRGTEAGVSLYPPLVVKAMAAGAHVWVEKPPANTLDQARMMVEASRMTGRFLGVGYKRMFMPTVLKAQQIMRTPRFGKPTALHYLFRGSLGAHDAPVPRDLSHPMGLVLALMGPAQSVYFERHAETGAASIIFRFVSGALGSVCFLGRAASSGPGERATVVGERSHLVIDNVIRLTYYRRVNQPGRYGREPTFIGADDDAPLFWEPEYTLGQMYNKNLFLIGYVGEVSHFANSVLAGTAPDQAGTGDLLEIMNWTEALHQPSGTATELRPGT
jgi:predicted dehydrogenase